VMGIPVVGPDWGPFPYLVKHGYNGLLFRKDSVEDLERQIARILDDDALYRQLCRGAERSSAEIRSFPVNFYQAVVSAFGVKRSLAESTMRSEWRSELPGQPEGK
jgi:glycosyltransferase involved in cell wall biosynthesis